MKILRDTQLSDIARLMVMPLHYAKTTAFTGVPALQTFKDALRSTSGRCNMFAL